MFGLIDFLFPKQSLFGHEGEWITDEERRKLASHPLRLSKDLLKKRGNTSLDQLVAAGVYDHNVMLKRAIKAFKYARIKTLGPELAHLMANAVDGLLLDLKDPVLCPVPLHWSREFSRGFNQSDELAKHLSSRLGLPRMRLLRRVHATGFQSHRKREERLTALENSFKYSGPERPPEQVILIDDLYTTGATVNSCAKELKKHGVKRVFGLVVAMG